MVKRRILTYCASAVFVSVTAKGLVAKDNPEQAKTQEILEEIHQIRQLIEKNCGAKSLPNLTSNKPKVRLKLRGDDGLGSATAEKIMVEFTDFQCPFCRRFHDSTFPRLYKEYIATGKLRYYSRDLPLGIHPDSFRAAEAGRCAGEQDKFWQMRNLMIAHPNDLSFTDLIADVKELNIPVSQFETCLRTERFKKDIEADIGEAMRLGAQGTPAFVIGHRTSEGVEGEVIVGAMSFDLLDEKLKEMQ